MFTFFFLQEPRLLGKQALHMSPAMTVFTVKDFDLYFHPSAAFIPLHTLHDTNPAHSAATLQSPLTPSLTSPESLNAEWV